MADSHEQERKYIQGTLDTLIYHNETSMYSVVKMNVKTSNEEMPDNSDVAVVTGYFPQLLEDETVTFFGHFHQHPRFGWQYQAHSYQKEMPTTEQGLIHYLSSDLFAGIGEKTAEKIVAKLGLNTIHRILNEDDALTNIQGLSAQKASVLKEGLRQHRGMEHILASLAEYGFGPQLSMKIYQAYQDETMDMVQRQPYQLMYDIEGIGFHRADELAKHIGIEDNAPERLQAACLYTLQEASQSDGHTYLFEHQLIEQMNRLLRQQIPEVSQCIQTLVAAKKMIQEDDRLYLAPVYYAEQGVRNHLVRLQADHEDDVVESAAFYKALGAVEEKRDIQYAAKQRDAVETALTTKAMILTGGPGTGKTTVIQGIVEVFATMEDLSLDPTDYKKDEPFPILLAAPTGRAAKRMGESTGLPAMTIHRLLGWDGEGGFTKNEENPVDGSLLIIDEVSMLDVYLANQLLKALPDHMKVIFVGDEDQLPSVGPGQVLKDLIDANALPVIRLTDIYRQAESSTIVQLAHQLKKGHVSDEILKPTKDRRFFACPPTQLTDVIVQVCESAIKKGYTPHDIQVLVPMYKGPAGIDAINARLQMSFNPPNEQKREVSHRGGVLRTGDKVLQLVNRPEDQVFNGDIGEIVAIFKAKETADRQEQIVVEFDEIEVIYTKQELAQLTLSYCCSVHKSQGSEYPIVVVPVSFAYRRMLKRKLLYTAITRSQEYLILCGQFDAFKNAISDDHEDGRQTSLALCFERSKTPDEAFVLQSVDEPGMEHISPYDFMEKA
ncbi:ATP-dependent RecD-like DNA helicase [Bacillaceae bacterium SIJ1]|uniref:SF1B family DNA helicase RecD2 n=1 Tax=Litoribacterium kuwaitense TaxID=1398745 RepID=UPI0013EDA324|nr:ATP-dependent RecD-like DNA helicase [Litoribacterium kuwaitense]NGP43454.1 ATP-dependent RecD-like DNA helicase [Litoribacterium kuwaitense]